MIRLDGGDRPARRLRIAARNIVPIIGYARCGHRGLILRIIEERAGFIGRWIAGLFGLAYHGRDVSDCADPGDPRSGAVEAAKEVPCCRRRPGARTASARRMVFRVRLVLSRHDGHGFVFVFGAAQPAIRL